MNVFVDMDAERSVIGAILQDPACWELLEELTADDFTLKEWQSVFLAARSLRAKRSAVDLVTIQPELLDACADVPPAMLIDAVKRVPSTANARHYADVLTERRRRRELRELCETTIGSLGESSADEAVDQAITRLRGMVGGKSGVVSFGDVMASTYEMLEAISRGELRGIATPLPDLNAMTAGGFRKGELTILAAGTGQGKSALALDIARHAAKTGRSVLVVSREMSKEQYGLRAFAALAGIETGKMLRAKGLTSEQWSILGDTLVNSQALPVGFTFTASTIEDVRREAQRQKQLDMLIVDYVQILGAKGNFASEHLRVSHISRMLKEIALDMNIPVLALSQFKRPAGGQAARPTLSDLKESGSLENDADNVWLMSRPKSDDDDAIPAQYAGWVQAAEQMGDRFLLLEIAKQRMYSPGMVGVCFSPSRMTFYNPTTAR